MAAGLHGIAGEVAPCHVHWAEDIVSAGVPIRSHFLEDLIALATVLDPRRAKSLPALVCIVQFVSS